MKELAVFWTHLLKCVLSPGMRRGLEIRVEFVSTRLSVDRLRVAYESVTPTTTRRIAKSTEESLMPTGKDLGRQKRTRGTGSR